MQVIEPVENSLDELHKKVDKLLPKDKTNREVLPLRDPIDRNLFPLFFTNAGSQSKRQPDLKQAQLRVAYTLLYHTGLRINEIRSVTEDQINRTIKTSQISVIHHKTKQPYIHVLSKQGLLNIKRIKPEIDIIFNKYKFKYLFGKEKPAHKKSVIRFINQDLKNTCEVNGIPFNIKSHSFRINMVSSLLKTTSVQNAAQLIGHKDIKSTMTYQRYSLSKDEIQKLLDEIN
jgi:integrase/recombinase XerD